MLGYLLNLLAYFPYFEEIKVGLWDYRVCVSAYPPINFWMAKPIFMKLGMHTMVSEPI
jgi:hypothetical protein